MRASRPHDEAAALVELEVQTSHHELQVLHDDGLYRHLRWSHGDSSIWCIDLITWPGHLVVAGDLPSYTFARARDMLSFFRGEHINPSYWSEKIISDNSLRRDAHRRYSPELAARFLQTSYAEAVQDEEWDAGLWLAMEQELLPYTDNEEAFRQELDAFEYPADIGPVKEPQFRFHDTWEYDFREYDFLFLVVLHAIVKIIKLYDATKS